MRRAAGRFAAAALLSVAALFVASPGSAQDPGSLRVRRLADPSVELSWTDSSPTTNYCILREGDRFSLPPTGLVAVATGLVHVDSPAPAPLPERVWFYDVEEQASCTPTCSAAADIACGQVGLAGNNGGAGSTDVVDAYPTCGISDATGSELVYRFQPATDADVIVDLATAEPLLHLFVLEDLGTGCDAASCVADGATQAAFHATGGSTYFVVVDGRQDAVADYTLDLTCSGTQCVPAGTIACGGSIDSTTAGATAVLDDYGPCSLSGEDGPELVYSFTPATSGPVTMTLSNLVADLDVIVLEDAGTGCDVSTCVDWGDDSVMFSATAGTRYFVVVDGSDPAGGPFRLQATCVPPVCSPLGTIACGTPIGGRNDDAGSTDVIDSWPCLAGDHSSPEVTWEVTVPFSGMATARLTAGPPFLDVFVLSATGPCDASACLAAGDTQASWVATAGTTYRVVVDGQAGAAAAYNLVVDCPPPPECVPLGSLACGTPVNGRNDDAGSTDAVDAWPCLAGDYTGTEVTWTITTPLAGTAHARLTAGGGPLSVFVLTGTGPCDATACLAASDTDAAWAASAGTSYRIVVDGKAGGAGAYTLVVDCPVMPMPVCESIGTLLCGNVKAGSTNDAVATDKIPAYPCTGRALPGPEEAFTFSATGSSRVTFSVTPEPGKDVDVLVLAAPTNACDPANCLAHGDTSVDVDVVTGQKYFIVVDGPDDATGVDYLLRSSGCPAGQCTPALTLGCGDVISASTGRPAATDINDAYPCAPGRDESANELTFAFEPDNTMVDTDVTIVMDNLTADLDVFVLENAGMGCDPASCIAWGDDGVTFTARAGVQYFVVVDGPVPGDFRIFAQSCIPQPLACVPGTAVHCGDHLTGQGNGQAGSTDNIDTYTTCPGVGRPPDESGPEYTYPFDAAANAQVTATLSNLMGQTPLHLFVLQDVGGGCDSTQCIAFGVSNVTWSAASGTRYYVVVEGFRGNVATYDLDVSCVP